MWQKKRKWLAVLLVATLILSALIFWREVGKSRNNQAQNFSAVPLSQIEKVKVDYVIDGDTVILADGRHVRYIGIDAPEMAPETGTENREEIIAGAVWSRKENERLVLDKEILLEKDAQEFDKYGRTLAYVWVDGKMVNEELLEKGAGQLMIIPPDTKYEERLKEATRRD